MLLLGSRLIGTSIMGLQTGTKLAQTSTPLINPSNLKVMAYEVEGPLLAEHPSFIRVADVRELSDIGMIIDSNDEFIGVNDVIKIHELYELGFSLVGMNVVDETKRKLGKVDDYSLDSDSFVIQQLRVKRGVIKSLTETGLLVHRSQIVEINDDYILVRTTAERAVSDVQTAGQIFVNPFRPVPSHPELSDH
ncbi:PRC-barrel domain-containing protein [Candidatus Saccharibacteria bacterium]|nr:PRC-barrel domain-containing protein [Candidatus Saccharibacteria bacterium]